MGVLGSARYILRWAGPRSLAAAVLRKTVSPVVELRRWYFFETDLTALPPPLEARVSLDVRQATWDDLDRVPEILRAAGVPREEAGRRLERGDLAILALSGGRPVHLHWIAFASPIRLGEIGIELHLAPGEAYGYGAYTLPEWRGYRVHPAVSSRLPAFERARGCVRHISYVRTNNPQSLKTMARVGRRRTKTVLSVRLLGWSRPLLFGVTARGSPCLMRPARGAAAIDTSTPTRTMARE